MTTTRDGTEPAAGTPAPAPEHRPDDQAAEPLTSGLPQLVHLLGTVVAPTTLSTSRLFYLGWSHAYYVDDYFGVNSTLLGLTTRDYVQKAVDGLFVPLMVVACVGPVALWAHSLFRASLGDIPRRRVAGGLAAIGAAGLVLAAGGLWSVFSAMVLELPREPGVVLFSERSLSQTAPGVREVRCKDPQAGYRLRHDGLKLLPHSGDQLLLLPERWSRRDGVAILIPRNDSLRLELIPASARATARSPTC